MGPLTPLFLTSLSLPLPYIMLLLWQKKIHSVTQGNISFAAKTFSGISDHPVSSVFNTRCTQGTQQGWKEAVWLNWKCQILNSLPARLSQLSACLLWRCALGKVQNLGNIDQGTLNVRVTLYWVTDAARLLVTRGLVRREAALFEAALTSSCL